MIRDLGFIYQSRNFELSLDLINLNLILFKVTIPLKLLKAFCFFIKQGF